MPYVCARAAKQMPSRSDSCGVKAPITVAALPLTHTITHSIIYPANLAPTQCQRVARESGKEGEKQACGKRHESLETVETRRETGGRERTQKSGNAETWEPTNRKWKAENRKYKKGDGMTRSGLWRRRFWPE